MLTESPYLIVRGHLPHWSTCGIFLTFAACFDSVLIVKAEVFDTVVVSVSTAGAATGLCCPLVGFVSAIVTDLIPCSTVWMTSSGKFWGFGTLSKADFCGAGSAESALACSALSYVLEVVVGWRPLPRPLSRIENKYCRACSLLLLNGSYLTWWLCVFLLRLLKIRFWLWLIWFQNKLMSNHRHISKWKHISTTSLTYRNEL